MLILPILKSQQRQTRLIFAFAQQRFIPNDNIPYAGSGYWYFGIAAASGPKASGDIGCTLFAHDASIGCYSGLFLQNQ
jgi:hypothetical protein